mmetsp:Transcript_7175/g.18284  ORF Transcript_7175/g.18284 Transcript_7175/m.18284 type:complete len:99 (+) Transcript_7175:177-473(+)|eukprot:CAMPEP_0202115248 /NCGR_PEP_ID=MMETSP0965-20130614/37975_1 /ASSEMBLY_ACC=CAM_ASM_000507 /TAXON_ID=4773 /ORGANISM="Schizochytrium aggregatum, Strain ATCC28209" /LENGTH=98 /DNA_ID=CAMNT_0048685031 /DNA_START=115 /DNA_END=411 /DNA_ORIENTATION=+
MLQTRLTSSSVCVELSQRNREAREGSLSQVRFEAKAEAEAVAGSKAVAVADDGVDESTVTSTPPVVASSPSCRERSPPEEIRGRRVEPSPSIGSLFSA